MNKIQKLKARLQIIKNSLKAFADKEDFTDEEKAQIENLNKEAKEVLASIKTLEDIESSINSLDQTPADPVVAADPVKVTVTKNSFQDATGFKNSGEFLMAVKNDKLGKKSAVLENSIYTRDDEASIFVPEEISDIVVSAIGDDDSLFAKATQLKCDGNSFSHPVDNKRPWNSGINVYMAAEGSTMTKSDLAQMDHVEHKLKKMYAYTEVSNETMEDASGFTSLLESKVPQAIKHKMNSLIISGAGGGGLPQGILNSGHLLTVAKESGQAADTIITLNIIKMMAGLIKGGMPVWLYNPAAETQLRTLKDDNDNYIFLASGSQMNNSPYNVLFNIPMLPMLGGVKALGDKGDIILCDLKNGYEVLTKAGQTDVKKAMSPHVAFDQDKMAFKWTLRWDGKCPFKSTVTNETGDATLSYLVALADRA